MLGVGPIAKAAAVGKAGGLALACFMAMSTAAPGIGLVVDSATGSPLGPGEEIPLLVFMIIASEGAAGVTGAGPATLAGGLQSHRPDLVDGAGIIVGIDRFLSEAGT